MLTFSWHLPGISELDAEDNFFLEETTFFFLDFPSPLGFAPSLFSLDFFFFFFGLLSLLAMGFFPELSPAVAAEVVPLEIASGLCFFFFFFIFLDLFSPSTTAPSFFLLLFLLYTFFIFFATFQGFFLFLLFLLLRLFAVFTFFSPFAIFRFFLFLIISL